MKLYVGNLPFKMAEQDMKALFEPYGELGEVVIIKDRFSGRSKGFGFVTVNDDEKAKQAIADLNGKDFEGRALTVNEAQPMQPREERGGFGGRPRGGFGGGRGGGGFGGERRGGFRRESSDF